MIFILVPRLLINIKSFQKLLMQNRKNSAIQDVSQKIFIGIAGGSAAGKTTLCENINRQMAFDRNFKVQIISLDCFYKSLEKNVDASEYNFDHPNALDFDLAFETLLAIKQGKQNISIPQYSFTQHRRLEQVTYIPPANIIFFEGLMAFHDKRIRDLLTYKIFIHCDDDIRLCRRLKRDTTQRGRTVTSVLLQYNKFVKKAFHDFIYPTIVYADLIIPGFRNNRVSVDFIVQHIKNINRHINFKQKVRKTKIYCFGQNQFYDLQYSDSSIENPIKMEKESFLVFPTADEHKRELQFFMSTLLSESFSFQYYSEIYLCQFMKILKTLFKQLTMLKNYQLKELQLMSIYQINDFLVNKNNEEKNIKIVFIPMILSIKQCKYVLNCVKSFLKNNPKMEVILLTICCDMVFPSLVYQFQLPRTVLINLYIITNPKRFRQSMLSNAMFTDKQLHWLQGNRTLIAKALCDFSTVIGIDLAKSSTKIQQIYNQFAKNETKPIEPLKNVIEYDCFIQHQLYNCEVRQISGYQVLSTILLIKQNAPKQKFLDKEVFIQMYDNLRELFIAHYDINQYLQMSDFKALTEEDLRNLVSQDRMKNEQFNSNQLSNIPGQKIAYAIYIKNELKMSRKQISQLSSKLTQLVSKHLNELFIIICSDRQYYLLHLTDEKINFYNPQGTTIKEILQSKENPTLQTLANFINNIKGVYLEGKQGLF